MKFHKKEIAIFSLVLAGSAAGLTIGGRFTPPAIGLVNDTLTEFQGGTVARASEVNENFAKLRASTEKINVVQSYLSSLVGELETEFELQDEVIAAQAEQVATLRSVPLRRPSFRWVDADSIVIDGAASRPMPVALGAEVRSLADTLDVHTTVVGPGGLDGGVAVANRLYYLYIVPLPAGGVAGIASLNPPTTAGPFGHGIWTYLGAFYTGSSSEVVDFVSVNGRFRSWVGSSGSDAVVTANGTGVVARNLLIPESASNVYGRFFMSAGGVGDKIGAGARENFGLSVIIEKTDNTGSLAFVEIPVLERSDPFDSAHPLRIHLSWTNDGPNDTITNEFRILGWDEDVMRYP